MEVIGFVMNNPLHSSTTFARVNDVATTTVQKYIRRHKFYPYKLMILNVLNEEDSDRRMQFFQITFYGKSTLHKKKSFSDECTFFLNGNVNRQNVRY